MTTDGHIWKKTGHALVIDADQGRKNHPWIILAHEWETAEEIFAVENADTGKLRPAKRVKRDDSKALGVLPGHKNRTPIARLGQYGKDDEKGPFVNHLGPDFAFDLVRAGKEGKNKQAPQWGTDLVEIMPWFWDPEKEEEVCYNTKCQEFMRYDPKTGEYSGPYTVPCDQVGKIAEEHAGPTSLASRFEHLDIEPGGSSGPS